LYYYMRVVVAMFISEATERTGLALSGGIVSVLAITVVLTLLMGLFPDPFIDLARGAVRF
jgi:NADH:ubiquinone oxidoreductase subunit 2 (subunit N)